MSGIDTSYTKEIHKQLGVYATWPFGTAIAPGDYGRLDGKVFVKEGSIVDQSWMKGQDGKSCFKYQFSDAGNISYHSSGEVKIDLSVSGSGKGATATVTVGFNSEYACLLECSNVKFVECSTYATVANKMVERLDAGKWDKDLYVVMQVWSTKGTTAMVARSSDTKVKLTGSYSGSSASEALATGTMSFASGQSGVESVVTTSEWVPYFKLACIMKPVLGPVTFEIED